jgi:hypothetical protein
MQYGPLVPLALCLSILSIIRHLPLYLLAFSLSISPSLSLSLSMRLSLRAPPYLLLSVSIYISFSLSICALKKDKREKDLLKRFTVHFNAYCQPMPVYAVSYRAPVRRLILYLLGIVKSVRFFCRSPRFSPIFDVKLTVFSPLISVCVRYACGANGSRLITAYNVCVVLTYAYTSTVYLSAICSSSSLLIATSTQLRTNFCHSFSK